MNKRVALVLGSGGARGYAHIGVIDELESRGYEVVAIAGCSMGAVIGGVYAAGELEGYRDWVTRLDYFDVLRLVDVTWSPMGAMRASKVMSKLESLLGRLSIEDLAIPFTSVATDLLRQREVWFQSGPLLRAIRASIAVPGLITPVHHGDQVLVDGGLMNPLPIIPTVAAHADLILAVNATAQTHRPVSLEELLPPAEAAEEQAREAQRGGEGSGLGEWFNGVRTRAQKMFSNGTGEGDAGDERHSARAVERAWGKLDIMLTSFEITQAALAKYKIAGYPPDVLVEIPKTVCGAYEFHRAEALICLGRHLARQALDRYEGPGGALSEGQAMVSAPDTGKPAN
ncbi:MULTISPECIES: patatin-like phospholipase family protein [unclassified Modicisalibacter]|uniref:patatin-like phospholipase family protein n=1 Tax=unclassified Modicisalibacter TaxID=2679913 RepID=UPI001CCAE488|nr:MULTISPECIES: patatin-like phospholipase family protein [unclassified Modicisalibacter]MBZ9560197.1 patatin-like phospholipase family protein [Modicisalibacter sp. R2A 31.J]MBZ9576105.1 patatin-like phospholipase family protein [Modicisalibacter sp. MOD 31.J]